MFLRRKKSETRKTIPTTPKLTFESLEERTLLSVSVRSGVLTLAGSTRADTYVVSLNAPAADKIVVSENGRARSFDRAKITAISANGNRGNDLIEIDQGNGQILLPTTLVGGDGNDTVIGGGGADRIDGQAGNDRLRGQAGNDTIICGAGHDDGDGGSGNDMLEGNDGDDILAGAAGDDVVNGGAGEDEVAGGDGMDQIVGGADDDHFEMNEVGGEVQDAGAGTDSAEAAVADAPQTVQDTLANLVGNGSLERLFREFTGSTITYEADYVVGNLDHTARLSDSGAVLEQEVEVDPTSLPSALLDAVLARYPIGVIADAEFSTSAAGDRFELGVEVTDVLHELTIGMDGVILTDEVESPNASREPSKFRDFASSGVVPFFHLTAGSTLTFEGDDKGEPARLVITVLDAIKMIDGVETRIVEERESKSGQLVEISRNYFAIDTQTNNLYYFGEDVDIYENGQVVAHDGAWRSGVRNAKFGLLLPGLTRVGLAYLQERAPGVALDTAQVVSTNETVVTPAGTFTGVLKIRETTPLEPGAESFKYYAPGVGLIQDNTLQLVSSSIV